MNSEIKFYTLSGVAKSCLVSKSTVKRWVRDGLLVPRYQVRSGRCYRLIFSEAELARFADENFPTPLDLDGGRGGKNADRVRRIANMHRLYLGKASAAAVAKLWNRAYPSRKR